MAIFYPQGGGSIARFSPQGGSIASFRTESTNWHPWSKHLFTRGSLGGGPRPKGGTPTPKKSGLEGPETQNFLLLLVYILVYTREIFGGGSPQKGGGPHLQIRVKKMEIFLHVFGAEGAAKNF